MTSALYSEYQYLLVIFISASLHKSYWPRPFLYYIILYYIIAK